MRTNIFLTVLLAVLFGLFLGFSLRDSRGKGVLKPAGVDLPTSIEKKAPSLGGVTLPVRESVQAAEEPTPVQTIEENSGTQDFHGTIWTWDMTPVSGGNIRFEKEGLSRSFPVSSDGTYITTPSLNLLAQKFGLSSPAEGLPQGVYRASYRESNDLAWQSLQDPYGEEPSSGIVLSKNRSTPQDFILRRGFMIVGNIRVDFPNSSGDLKLFSEDGEVVAETRTRIFSERTRRPERFDGDSETPRSGEFCFSNITPGEYILRFYAAGAQVDGKWVDLHWASSISVSDKDVFLEDILLNGDLRDFELWDPSPVLPAKVKD